MAAFEEKLTLWAGEEGLKEAKQLLKQKHLISAWRDREHRICGVFREEGNGMTECSVLSGEEPFCVCSRCGSPRLCAHGAALLMHAGRFRFFAPPPEAEPNYYGGLRKQELSQLAARGKRNTAELFLNVAHASPHAPSKWENMVLCVRMKTAVREYIGNQNNLRQLYFDKSLSVVLKFDDFSLHDQQLIRYLAVNGEPENSNISLNSEQTAEFFHALPGFPRFFRENRRITVHRTPAEAVLVEVGGKVSPGLKIDHAVLPFANARVIAGKAGCWVGKEEEYFFLGGSCEVGFLRSFFRSPAQAKSGFDSFPLPVLKAGSFEVETRPAGILFDGLWPKDGNGFELRCQYLYHSINGEILALPGSGSLGMEKEYFWKREKEREKSLEMELALSGAELETAGAVARFKDGESAALFLDRALPELLALHPGSMLSARLAALLHGIQGLPELEFRCEYREKRDNSFLLSYTLGLPDSPAEWEDLLAASSRRSRFVNASGRPLKITPAQALFFRAAPGMLRSVDPAARTFELPFCNLAYFSSLVKAIPGAMPPELADSALLSGKIPEGKGFPFKGELRHYQKEGVAFLQTLSDRGFNGLLADEMGLGKTVQLLAFLASRMREGAAPALIVCPASLVTNWEREAARFVPSFRIAAPAGNVRSAVLAKPEGFDLLILSYTAVRLAAGELRRIHFSFAVLDEAQHIKNPGSGNAKNCKNLRADHRIVLTGTPLENSPEDLWSVMDFLQPGMLGTLPAFRRRYAEIAADDELQKDLTCRIAPFIKRRTKALVASDLPQKTENSLFCDFSAEQRELYEAIRSEGKEKIRTLAGDERRCGAEIFATLMKLRQVCCDPALLPECRGGEIPSVKRELALELLHETIDSGHKVLLFSQFTSLLKQLIPDLEREKIPFEYLDGTTRNRQQRVDRFNQTPEIPLFLLSLKAGGTGLNLTSADTVIIYDPWWNPTAELQAADRTHRIGQTRSVTISKLVVRNSVEEKILSLQAKKRELFFHLVENPAKSSSFTLKELQALLE